ncbi:MAG: helix-turn-helix transcriptional regulator [Hydrogenophaga sp.]|nr:helix-turn-helix transcriptional regulator [Hydrogenophaga sp.]
MTREYNHSYIDVNNSSCFTQNKFDCISIVMTFGERLKIARQHAMLSQVALADKVQISQANISKLEIGEANGSEYTVQFAMACSVRPEWLATGQGEMTDGLYVEDVRIKKAVLLMQELPDYALDEAIKGLDSVSKLSKMAR